MPRELQNGFTPSCLEIRLLGPFRVAVDGAPVGEDRWSRRKPKQLVKLLALQPHHRLHREQLIELLWPERDMEAAANNLHKAIHLARHALEPRLKTAAGSHFIHTQGKQVVLSAPGTLWVDAEEFEQAAGAVKGEDAEACEAALALYGGDLLAEDLYEDWGAARREQLRTLYQELLAKLARLYAARGEHRRSVERLQELVARDPTNEEAHRQLMRLYALKGNKHQALRQYHLCCEALRKELHAEPERATHELRRQIVAGQLAPRPRGEVGPGADPGAAINSLAVLPFTDAGSDPEAEYLSDGITETIISNLSQLARLRVKAWSTVSRYKGREVNPQEVGGDLGVRAVLTGKVLRVGDRLVIRAELADTSDGAQLWGGQYDGDFSDVLAIQEEIARRISESLQLKLAGEEQKGRRAEVRRRVDRPLRAPLRLAVPDSGSPHKSLREGGRARLAGEGLRGARPVSHTPTGRAGPRRPARRAPLPDLAAPRRPLRVDTPPDYLSRL